MLCVSTGYITNRNKLVIFLSKYNDTDTFEVFGWVIYSLPGKLSVSKAAKDTEEQKINLLTPNVNTTQDEARSKVSVMSFAVSHHSRQHLAHDSKLATHSNARVTILLILLQDADADVIACVGKRRHLTDIQQLSMQLTMAIQAKLTFIRI